MNKGDNMFLYWRVQQDLACLEEVITFHNPSFIRSYQTWLKRNAAGILLAEGIDRDNIIISGLN